MLKKIVTVLVPVNFRTAPARASDKATMIRTLKKGDELEFMARQSGGQLNWIKAFDPFSGRVGFVSEGKNGVTHVRVSDVPVVIEQGGAQDWPVIAGIAAFFAFIVGLIYLVSGVE